MSQGTKFCRPRRSRVSPSLAHHRKTEPGSTRTTGLRPRDEKTLVWNLKGHGAPLAQAGKPGEKLSVTETLAKALKLARWRWDVAGLWPVVFLRNRQDVDLQLLERMAVASGQERILGFYLSLVRFLTKDASTKLCEGRLMNAIRGMPSERFSLQARGTMAMELEKRRAPTVAKRWGLWMNATVAMFADYVRKFDCVVERAKERIKREWA